MSYNVYVVCEDHTLDQYVCVPIVKSLMNHLGKPRATVRVVTSPRLTGIDSVYREFESIAERYAAIGDLVIFALDRDGLDGRSGNSDRRAQFEGKKSSLRPNVAAKVEVVLAVEETEVWALWGSRSAIADPWTSVRGERDSKERYFHPLVPTSDRFLPGGGRKRLVEASLANGWVSIASGCPELKDLEAAVAVKMP